MFGSSFVWWFALGLTIRPYAPPVLGPEPELLPSSTKVVEIAPASGDWDANVLARPIHTAPLVGNVARGARVVVRGEVLPNERVYCPAGVYYAIEPFGYVCGSDTQPSQLSPTTESVLKVVEDTPLPYAYAQVLVPEGSTIPMWDSLESLQEHASPERELGRGDSIALSGNQVQFEGASYYVTLDEKIVPTKNVAAIKHVSQWQGIVIDDTVKLPFAWVTPKKAPVYAAPKGTKIDELPRRTRVEVLEEVLDGSTRFLRIGEGRYMKADQLNEVRVIARPEGTGTHAQWFDVDLGEQVVVAYRNEQPVYATLIASGREPNHTPRGNYPVWGKASAVTMKSQDYDDKPYYVNRVPWVMFFQAHNALHGAYWHDQFGVVKSHGCANLAPRDAQYLFDWLEPKLPAGWTAVRFWDLTQAPVVHVRNSKKTKKPFFQERNIGPPDKDDELQRLEQAIVRREQEERAKAEALGIMIPQ